MRRIRVLMGESLVGTIDFEARTNKQISTFRYDAAWMESGFAIAPSMPLATGTFYSSAPSSDPRPALPGAIADGAPDGWGRRLIAGDLGGRPSELDYLLAVNDRTRQGALRFVGERGVPLADKIPPVPRMAALSGIRRLANAFETGRGDLREVAHELRGAGSTLGGARPKSDFEDADGTLHIAKYTTERDTLPIERLEVATLELAGEAGLRAAKARLALGRSSYPVALIRRFDRTGNHRHHYISAKTFLGFSANETGCYADLADAMRSACGEHLHGELRELHRRILFSILVSNDDDHLKNHGFIREGETWRLSPAFDINPNPDGSTRLHTGISEPNDIEPSIEAVVEAAPLFDVDKEEAREDARRMAGVVAARWRPLCAAAGMTRTECARYEPAFRRAVGETAKT
ncbi:MAG: type II toxin-antitoxin system HipA family toxin [Gammaproteobacteria bacterium]|nr:type II toxin-antitoxin system HipA family toxin [Gammaproteobacteria bacterium]